MIKQEKTNVTMKANKSNDLSAYGYSLLISKLYSELAELDNDDIFRQAKLENGIYGFSWLNKGKITKRIRRYFSKAFNHKVSDDFITEIGNIFHLHGQNNDNVIVDITDTIDWQAGDFGDRGSCFWGFNSHHRDAIDSNSDFYAIREYSADGDGIGRAFIYRYDKDNYFVFNGYHDDDDKISATLRYATILHKIVGARLETTKVTTDTDVYLNENSYHVGNKEFWSIAFYAGVFLEECDNCGYEIENGDEVYHTHDGSTLCGDCASYCDSCEHWVADRIIHWTTNGQWVCNDCAVQCDCCEGYEAKDHVVTLTTREGETLTVCRECHDNGVIYEQGYDVCENCGVLSSATTYDGNNETRHCPDCTDA